MPREVADGTVAVTTVDDVAAGDGFAARMPEIDTMAHSRNVARAGWLRRRTAGASSSLLEQRYATCDFARIEGRCFTQLLSARATQA